MGEFSPFHWLIVLGLLFIGWLAYMRGKKVAIMSPIGRIAICAGAVIIAVYSLPPLLLPFTAVGHARDALSNITPDQLAVRCGKPIRDEIIDEKDLESRNYQIRTMIYQTLPDR